LHQTPIIGMVHVHAYTSRCIDLCLYDGVARIQWELYAGSRPHFPREVESFISCLLSLPQPYIIIIPEFLLKVKEKRIENIK